jgi:branched-subunit amino acid transport protein
MGDAALIAVAAVITYLSRAAAVVLLPVARGALLGFVHRVPAPLFAGLAIFALVGDELTVPDPSTIGAVVGALVASPRRSLGLTLAAGITGFLVVEWLL